MISTVNMEMKLLTFSSNVTSFSASKLIHACVLQIALFCSRETTVRVNMASFNGNDSHSEFNSIKELRDYVKVCIDQSKEKKRQLKERTDELTATLKQTIDELSTVYGEYRDLVDYQNETLKSVHGKLSKYEGEDEVVDKGETVPPTQVEGSESPGTSRRFTTPASQPQNERIQIETTELCPLHVQKVVYSKRTEKKNQLTLCSSSSSSASPYLSRHSVEISDEETTAHVSKEDVQAKIIDGYQDGDNCKQFACPYQLANGPNNELIISDRDRHQLVVFDENLRNSCVYGKMGFGEGNFFFPTGLAVDVAESCLFVVDHNNIIQKFKITYPGANKFPCQFEYIEKYGRKGNEKGELNCPSGLAFSKKELRLFVCDQQNHRIQIFTNEGTVTHAFGKRGDHEGEFNEPHSITINKNEDKLFVSDHSNNRVQVFTPQGEFIQIIVDDTNAPTWPQLQYPRGIYCTHDSRVLVSSTHTNCILEFEEDGTYKSTMEGVRQPCGIILHHIGGVVVTCTGKKNIIIY